MACIGFLHSVTVSFRIWLWPSEDVVAAFPFSWARRFREFHCLHCGGALAYQSRVRGFFEKRMLPLLLLKPVRCEHCFHRVYVFRTTTALVRPGLVRKAAGSDSSAVSARGRHIA
jgi:hypothetical protein